MRLSTIYSALLTALALGVSAGPIPEVSGLEVIDTNAANIHVPRAPPKPPAVVPTKTKRYEAAVAAARRNLAPGWYAFTIEWDLPAAVEGNFESKTELEVLQRKLGFEHVAVVAGESAVVADAWSAVRFSVKAAWLCGCRRQANGCDYASE